ncbi:MAG: hypothetical protein COA84_15380 [Robiginitomaculum sp.]|nr:MAG: hypothetical protein COA84_15380 [Robiginitomaculum sp.]
MLIATSKARLAISMALRTGKAFGVKMHTLLRMQTRFDAYQVREREDEVRVQRFAGGEGAF